MATPTFVIDSDGELISAVGLGSGEVVFSGAPWRIALARQAANAETPVHFIWDAEPLIAGWETEEGILAALLAVAPGRSYIKEAPESIIELIHGLAGHHSPDGDPGRVH